MKYFFWGIKSWVGTFIPPIKTEKKKTPPGYHDEEGEDLGCKSSLANGIRMFFFKV